MVTSIAVSPNNSDVVYLGTAIGGVWRSVDGGLKWTPIFDQQPVLGIGEPDAVAIDTNDTTTIYVGTSSRDIRAGNRRPTDCRALQVHRWRGQLDPTRLRTPIHQHRYPCDGQDDYDD